MVEGAGNRRDVGMGAAAGVLAAQCSVMKKAVESAEGWGNRKRPEHDGLDDLIKAYYAVSSVMTLAGTLKGTARDDELSRLISDAESFVSERFDNVLHRDAKRVINDMMRDVMNELTPSSHAKLLQGRNTAANGTDAESEKYAWLRSLMSVREFMGQYDAMVRDRVGLYHDGTSGDDGDYDDANNGNHVDGDDGGAAALGENTGRNLDRSDAGL